MTIKVKKYSMLLFIVLFLADHCFWLVNANVQNFANEICWMIIFLVFCIVASNENFSGFFNGKEYYFGKLILFTIVMGTYSTFQAMRIHGQSLGQGFIPQRFMIVGCLLYFVLMNGINIKKEHLKSLEKVFLTIGYIELFLYVVQYLLVNSIMFLNITVRYRLDGVRMNLGAIGIPYIIFRSVNNIYNSRKLQWRDIVGLGGGLFYSFIITKTRIVLLAYIIAFIGGYIVWKKGGKKKFIVFFILVIFIYCMSKTSLFSYLIDGINGVDMSSQTREIGREYYLTRIAEHPLIGCGYINMNNINAVAYAGINNLATGKIAWVDLGIYGLAFFFGIIGLIWFVLLYGKMTIKSYQIARNGDLTYWMYMVYSIIICPNGTSFLWYISGTVAFVVWMCLIEGNHKALSLEKGFWEN